ncbi:RHS repeat domain-containing protein [Sulfurospirillum arcachonense]|uniref:RHS repeat domain-containing protein n=1 Tax=Sulfurospirillum arcachonense TaxID=57666 RepID=UPI00046985A0|nr:RHS repeat protein [Sulfurospirillum arcachonense]
MIKALSSKGIVLVLLILSINVFASQTKMHVLQPCNNTQDIYSVNSLCIDGEKITRKNFLDTYGGDEVQYRTKSSKYTSITSKAVGNKTIWELTNQNGLTFSYSSATSTNTITKLTFAAVTYTGNGTSQDIVTGISSVDFTKPNNGSGYWHDRATGDGVVKNDAGDIVESGEIEVNTSKVHIKGRSAVSNNFTFNGLFGAGRYVYTDVSSAEGSNLTTLSGYNSNGVSLGTNPNITGSTKTYILYQTLYTHIKWGLTNQGKRYIEAYNPITKDTMILYQGSGVAGHEIPHSVGAKLDIAIVKNLTTVTNWDVKYNDIAGDYLLLDLTNAKNNSSTLFPSGSTSDLTMVGSSIGQNTLNQTFVMYGKAKSKTWAIVEYTGTGTAGNFIETKDIDGVAKKPARIIIKGLNVNPWFVFDNQRGFGVGNDSLIHLENAEAEYAGYDYFTISNEGFTLSSGNDNVNTSGINYIALVEFDTNADGGGSYTTEEEAITIAGEKVYRLISIKDASNNINIPIADSEVTFLYNIEVDKQNLSQIITTNKEGLTSYYDVSYDGDLLASITSATGAKTLTEYLLKTYNYNDQGKILRETITGTNIEPRVTKYEYKEINETFSKKEINPLGHIITKVYDANGNLLALTDANDLTTTWTYDEQNRVTQETKPDGNTISYVYSTDDLIENAAYKVSITSTLNPEVIKYYDVYNKKIQTVKIGFNGRYILEDILYDERGRIASYSLPYFKGEKAYFINLTYDLQNRITIVDKPAVDEQRAVTSYVYNEDGTISITYPDNRVEVVREDGKVDTITYTYDVLGNLIKTVDTNGKTTNISYDALNRIVKKEVLSNANQDITYNVYDRANYGIGKLAYTKSAEYKKEYFYDELGRLKANKELIENKTFTTQYTYLANGKLDKTISPDGFESINEYNEYGYLSAVKSPKKNSSELSATDLQDLVASNLANEYTLYTEYIELKAKVNYYSLKKVVYETLAPKYATIDPSIHEQLNEVATLLGETIVLLQKSVSEYESVLANYKSIRENQLLAQLTNSSDEDNFKWLNETMKDQAKQYASLATIYVDKSSALLEGIITTPSLLEDDLNIDQDLVTYYKNQSNEIIAYANNFYQLASNYLVKYTDLKKGNGSLQDNSYLGMFDNSEFKYFYKIIDEDPLGRVINAIYGNGLVTKKEYDSASGNLLRITTGYYGNNDIRDIQYAYDKNNNIITKYDVKQDFTQTYKYDATNRLISASNVGESFYVNLVYSYIDPSQSSYTYDVNNNTFTKTTDNTLIGLNKPNLIENDSSKVETLYSKDGQSYKKTITINDENATSSYKINKSFMYNLKAANTTYKNLIYVKGVLVAIHVEDDIGGLIVPSNYYLHKDLFGSLDSITNEAAILERNINYRPFGEPSDVSWAQTFVPSKDITSIGYRGFEHNYDFGLIDMGGYMYDPIVGKSLSDKLFIYANPTTYMDATLENWNKNFLDITDAKPLYNIEMSRKINSLSSFSNIYIGEESPTDTSKIWYHPNESGALDIYVYNNGEWDSMGSTGSIDSEGIIKANSLEQLNTLPCFYKDKGFVDLQNGQKNAYTCTAEQTWQLGGEFVGTYTLIDMVTIYNDATEGSKITAVLSSIGNKEFIKTGNVWSADTIQVANNPAGRDSFTTLNSSFTYYLLNNDCTADTCNGNSSNSYYSGALVDGMYSFNYVSTGKHKNNLTDATPVSSIAQMYTDSPNLALFNNQTYLKTADNKGNSCYKREDGVFITKANVNLPEAFVEEGIVNLPTSDSCENAVFVNNALALASYTEATDWADAPNSVKVAIGGTEYTHIVNGTQDFWTDNATGDGQISATFIFTKGDRGNLPTLTHNLTAITKQLGTQANYTTTGLAYASDTSFKQWFYATTGTRTNNMEDNPCVTLPISEAWSTDFSNKRCQRQVNESYTESFYVIIKKAVSNGSSIKKNSTGETCYFYANWSDRWHSNERNSNWSSASSSQKSCINNMGYSNFLSFNVLYDINSASTRSATMSATRTKLVWKYRNFTSF